MAGVSKLVKNEKEDTVDSFVQIIWLICTEWKHVYEGPRLMKTGIQLDSDKSERQ